MDNMQTAIAPPSCRGPERQPGTPFAEVVVAFPGKRRRTPTGVHFEARAVYLS